MLKNITKFLKEKIADSAKAVLQKVSGVPEQQSLEEYLSSVVPNKSHEEDVFEKLVFVEVDPIPDPPPIRIRDSQLEAFTRKDLETALQLQLHLKNLDFDFTDLEYYLENIAKIPVPEYKKERVVPVQGYLTREERRHRVKRTRKGTQRRLAYDNSKTSK